MNFHMVRKILLYKNDFVYNSKYDFTNIFIFFVRELLI